MTLQAPMRCSTLAEQLDEPMIGSVDHRLRWLLVEDRSAWGRDAVQDLFGPDVVARAKELRLRILLVRRQEGDPAADAIRRAILVDTVSGAMAIRTITDPAELSVERAATLPVAEFGAPMSDPMFLVCTNGKRDACCALRGRALIGALGVDHAERVWECTHLGGHRFAANLVCLPHGIVYGHVDADDGPRLADAYLDGRLDPLLLRGRSAWPAPAQVAEQALRGFLGLDGIEDLTLLEADIDGSRADVTLATLDGVAHRVELRAFRSTPPRPISCRADELEEPLHWQVVEVV
ncbi:MAG: sucrase ferredoxin [Candidatus Limnocylindria bacterium]